MSKLKKAIIRLAEAATPYFHDQWAAYLAKVDREWYSQHHTLDFRSQWADAMVEITAARKALLDLELKHAFAREDGRDLQEAFAHEDRYFCRTAMEEIQGLFLELNRLKKAGEQKEIDQCLLAITFTLDRVDGLAANLGLKLPE